MEPKKNTEVNPEDRAAQIPSVAPCYLLPCPFCGKPAQDVWYEFDIPRTGCSDDRCPAAFLDDGVDLGWWQSQKKTGLEANPELNAIYKMKLHEELTPAINTTASIFCVDSGWIYTFFCRNENGGHDMSSCFVPFGNVALSR